MFYNIFCGYFSTSLIRATFLVTKMLSLCNNFGSFWQRPTQKKIRNPLVRLSPGPREIKTSSILVFGVLCLHCYSWRNFFWMQTQKHYFPSQSPPSFLSLLQFRKGVWEGQREKRYKTRSQRFPPKSTSDLPSFLERGKRQERLAAVRCQNPIFFLEGDFLPPCAIAKESTKNLLSFCYSKYCGFFFFFFRHSPSRGIFFPVKNNNFSVFARTMIEFKSWGKKGIFPLFITLCPVYRVCVCVCIYTSSQTTSFCAHTRTRACTHAS